MRYRPEIDGLRSVAVIPVIFFHAGLSSFSGGFIGVDVFFAISGYLITTLIYNETSTSTFSLLNFYERRIRRILPALFAVLITCLPFGWLWMTPEDFRDFGSSLLAVNVFASNIFFWRQNGYFAPEAEFIALLHTWSLGIEEQFYLFFPVLLIAVRRFREPRVICLLILLSVTSLALSAWCSVNFEKANFFLLPTRAWELGTGSIAALILRRWNPNTLQISDAASGIGLAAILLAVFLFDESGHFPNLWTLLPIVGTAAIILFADEHTLVGRLLSWRPMVRVGQLSYSAYLWHQPIFVFARLRIENFDPLIISGLISLTFVLAMLSWRFIEIPFRSKALFNRRQVFSYAASSTLILSIAGFSIWSEGGFPQRMPSLIQSTETLAQWETHVRDGNCYLQNPYAENHSKECFEETSPQAVLWGDSHAAALYPGLHLLQGTKAFGLIQLTQSGCPPLLNVGHLAFRKNCKEINSRILAEISAIQPRLLILHAAWRHYRYPMKDRDIAQKLDNTLRYLRQKLPRTHIVVIGPVPRWPKSAEATLRLLAKAEQTNTPQEYLYSDHAIILHSTENALEGAAAANDVQYISAINTLCKGESCLLRLDNGPGDVTAIDEGHLSQHGSEYFIQKIRTDLLSGLAAPHNAQ